MSAVWGIHWFRRDLRISGNAALEANLKKTAGKTLGIFCFDSKFLSRPDFSHNRFAFFLKTLRDLKEDMKSRGGELLVVDQLPADFFAKLFSDLGKKSNPLPGVISFGRDYEPFARDRDKRIQDLLAKAGVEAITMRDHLLFEPHEIFKSQPGDYYQIYSPFGKKWFDFYHSDEGQARIQAAFKNEKATFKLKWKEAFPSHSFRDELENFEKQNEKHVTIPIPDAGFSTAYKTLKRFTKVISEYKDARDFPAQHGTSKLSIFLKNGSLTVPHILNVLSLTKLNWKSPSGETQYVKELAWREFYYHILYHRPDVEKQAFHKQYANIQWSDNEAHFKRWQEGTTGFPIVDAGMRELRATGWMHNRVRMIVASFLSKDLLINWQWGENHFMHELLDGDLAPNNGGWQWAASTGCDPQPYFRIFNPWLQGKKFDPDGDYIKKYIPELKDADVASLHDPQADRSRWKYPAPIVDHFAQKAKALALYKK